MDVRTRGSERQQTKIETNRTTLILPWFEYTIPRLSIIFVNDETFIKNEDMLY